RGVDPSHELRDRSHAYRSDYNVWIPKLLVSITTDWYKSKAEAYRGDRVRCGAGLTRISHKWRNQPDKDFMYWVKDEAGGYIRSIIQKYWEHVHALERGHFAQ